MNKNLKKSYILCRLGNKVSSAKYIAYVKLGINGGRYRAKRLGGRKVLSLEDGNMWLYEHIMSGNPFAAVRYGGTELGTYKAIKTYELGFSKGLNQALVDNIQRQSGFFPNDLSLMPRYEKLMEDTSAYIDCLATLSWPFENFMIRNFLPKDSVVCDNRAFEPYYLRKGIVPWTKALEGKRVLVVHPFEDSIKHQYAQREFLFENKDILPEFELHTLKAVQTIVGTKDERFETWFDALEWMFNEAMKKPFDVALLGCGAYGQPLASMLRKAGKQAIHIGGATQILFGIRGRRWELNSPIISSLFNEYWIRPSAEETPQNKEKNECGGAYW